MERKFARLCKGWDNWREGSDQWPACINNDTLESGLVSEGALRGDAPAQGRPIAADRPRARREWRPGELFRDQIG